MNIFAIIGIIIFIIIAAFGVAVFVDWAVDCVYDKRGKKKTFRKN